MAEAFRTVLVTDDDDDLRELLETALAQEGFVVASARDGAQALAQVRASWPDLIVLDMMMPEVDGIRFLEHLCQDFTPPLPKVIAYSGFDGFRELALTHGAAAFIKKPFNLDHLLDVIEAVRKAAPAPESEGDVAIARLREERRNALLDAAHLRDVELRRQLRYLTGWAADYFGIEKSFAGVMHHDQLVVLAQSGNIDIPEDTPVDPTLSYCPEVTRAQSPLVIRDSTAEMPFHDRPASRSKLRFYAGAPLLTSSRVSLGALCVRDSCPFEFHAEDMAVLSYFARRVGEEIRAVAENGDRSPFFQQDRVLSEEAFLVMIEAELRRAERDRGAVLLAVVRETWSEPVTAAVLAAASPRRLALAQVGKSLAGILMDGTRVQDVEARLDAILDAIAANEPPRATGVARFEGESHRLIEPLSLLQAATDACVHATLRGEARVVRRL